MKKRLMSLTLVFAMVASMVPAVFAAEPEHDTINYVSIGDSMANGYCFEGYAQDSRDRNVYDFKTGTGMYGDGAYPLQFEEHLVGKGYHVNHTKLAPSALLAEDLLYLLGGRETKAENYWGGYEAYTSNYTDAELMPYFQTAIKEADIITMGIGNASFGAYMLQLITDALGIMGADPDVAPVDMEEAIAELETEEEKQFVRNLYNDLKDNLEARIPAEMAEDYDIDALYNIVAYTAATYIVNYKGVLEQIAVLNRKDNLDIILVGLLNTTYGMEITGEGFSLPIGDAMDAAFSALNTYMAGLPVLMQAQGKLEDITFYYAEQPEPKFICQVFDDLMENDWEPIQGGRLSGDTVRSRNITAYNDMLRGMISLAFSNDSWQMTLPKINLEDVQKFEEELEAGSLKWDLAEYGMGYTPDAAFSRPNPKDDKNLSIAIYLGIEKAVANSTNTMEIPLEGLMNIADSEAMMGVFGGFQVDVTDLGDAPTPAAVGEKLGNYLTYATTDPVEGQAPDELMQGMCKVYGLFKVGNGMSVHPTPEGHDEIAAAVIAAYGDENHTSGAVTDKNLQGLVAMAYEMAYGKFADYAPVAVEYLTKADAVLPEVIDFVKNLSVDARLEGTRALLEQELGLTAQTVDALIVLLADGELEGDDFTVLASLINSLSGHKATIEALAAELEIVGDIALDQLYIASEFVSDWAEKVANEAYAYLLAAGEDFSDAYADFVENITDAIAEISPELADVVEAYLTETPAAALRIVYTAGEDAVNELVAVALPLAEDIEAILTGLSVVLSGNVNAYIEAVQNSNVANIQAAIDAVKAELNATKKEFYDRPISTALAYEQKIAELEAEIAELEQTMINEIIDAVKSVDPVVAASVEAAWNALVEIAAKAEIAGGAYADFFAGRFELMSGELLNLIIEQTAKYGPVAAEIINELIRDLVGEVAGDLLDKVGMADIDLSELKAVIADMTAEVVAVKTQLHTLENYTGTEGTKLVHELETEVAEAEAYLNKLTAMAEQVEDLVNEIENEPEMTVEKVQNIVALAKSIVADTENLVNDTKAALVELGVVYETVIPQLIAVLEAADGPVGNAYDVTVAEIEAFAAELQAGYTETAEAFTAAAANIDVIVAETVAEVAESVTDAIAAIEEATVVAYDEITTSVNTAVDTIEAAAVELANSTDAEIRAAGEQILNSLDALELVNEDAYAAELAEINAIVMALVENAKKVEDQASAEAFFAEAETALAQLAEAGLDIYELASAEAVPALQQINVTAQDAVLVIEAAASLIGSNAVAAHTVSVQAVLTAASEVETSVVKAIAAYEQAVVEAANEIIPAVTEAAQSIAGEAAAVVAVASAAVDGIVAQGTTSANTIVDVWANIFAEATHGEYDVYCDSYYVALGDSDAFAEELAELLGEYVTLGDDDDLSKADFVTVALDTDEMMGEIVDYVLKMVGYSVNAYASEDLKGVMKMPVVQNMIAELGLDLDVKELEVPDWSIYSVDEAVVAAVLAEVESALIKNGVPETYTLPLTEYFMEAAPEYAFMLEKMDLSLTLPAAELATAAAEYALYAYAGYAAEYAELYEKAPADAQIILVGTHNEVEDVLGLPVGEYLDYAFAAMEIQPLAYALLNDNVTFVCVEDGNAAEAIYAALDVNVLGHDYTAVVTEPTCTEKGYTTYTCGRCGDEYVTDYVDALGHNYKDGVCTVCGQKKPTGGTSSGGSVFVNPFKDVNKSDYFYKAVMWAVQEGITAGTGIDTFSPHMACTRGQVVTMLWRAAGSPRVNAENPFTDVSKSDYYYNAVLWAVKEGITAGTSATTFSPNMVCSRAQIMTFVWKSIDAPAAKGANPFVDVTADAYYAAAVTWAAEKGVTAGTGANTFSPDDECSRAQTVTFLWKVFG